MKLVEKHISRLFVAVFLVFGNVAIASETFSDKAKASVADYVQYDGNSKPFVFDEISIGEISQTVSQNENLGFGVFGIFNSNQNFSFVQVSSSFNAAFALKDKRELIFQYLFPFHFFW